MKILKLVFKNSFRHKLRTTLTILGIAIAVMAFGLLRTVVTAWNSGVEAASANRLVSRHSVSFIFPLPLSYKDKIEQIPGVEEVSYADWFGGTYIDKNNFFARLAVDVNTFFDVYPEYELSKSEKDDFIKQRNACVVGSEIAKKYNFKIGDVITLKGDIYPGNWEFVVRGIYNPKYKSTDATQLFMHWDYINENLLKNFPTRANEVGWYIEKIKNPDKSAFISSRIDALFQKLSCGNKN